MATLVDRPTLASVNPASNEALVFASHEIVEWASHNGHGCEYKLVRAILDETVFGEAIQNEERAGRLGVKPGVARRSIGEKIVYANRLRGSERSDGLTGLSGEIGRDVARGHRRWFIPPLRQKWSVEADLRYQSE